MQKIFANTWVWVGHESEIPAKNTFKTAYVGVRTGYCDPGSQGQYTCIA